MGSGSGGEEWTPRLGTEQLPPDLLNDEGKKTSVRYFVPSKVEETTPDSSQHLSLANVILVVGVLPILGVVERWV